MKFGYFFCSGASWADLEKLICDIQLAHARGTPRLIAIEEGLSKSGVAGFRNLSKNFISANRFSDVKRLIAQLKFSHPEVRCAFEVVFPFTLLSQNGVCRLANAEMLLGRFSGFSRFVDQHLAQTRAQCFFLVLFLPLVSFFFCYSGSVHFFNNIANQFGFMVFLFAIVFYFSGVFILFLSLKSAHTLLFNRSLQLASGQAFLLRRLMTSFSSRGGSLGVLSSALADAGSVKLKQVSRAVAWGSIGAKGIFAESFRISSESTFLESVSHSYLLTSAELRERWLERNHEFLFASLQEQIGRRTAALNLQLMLVMAIFFLPALFLMLWLSGTPASPGTIM